MGAKAVAANIQFAVRELAVVHAGGEWGIATLSAGVAAVMSAPSDDAPDTLPREADRALYSPRPRDGTLSRSGRWRAPRKRLRRPSRRKGPSPRPTRRVVSSVRSKNWLHDDHVIARRWLPLR